MLVSASIGLRFFCCLFREEEQRPHALLEENKQKERLAIKLSRAESPARTTTRSSPHGGYETIRNARWSQSLFTTARRSCTISVSRGWSAGAFFLWPWGCWYGRPHEAARVDCSLLPTL